MNNSNTYKLSDLKEFDIVDHLRDETAIAQYLSVVLEDNDPDELTQALSDVARARGMMSVAKQSGLAREALYRSLRRGSRPRFDTVNRVCRSLGVKLVAQPLAA